MNLDHAGMYQFGSRLHVHIRVTAWPAILVNVEVNESATEQFPTSETKLHYKWLTWFVGSLQCEK